MKNTPVNVSVRIYRKILCLYPGDYREKFGLLMVQLFQDMARDAWREAHWSGLIWLWARTIPDFIKSLILERLTTKKGITSMLPSISKTSLGIFLATAISVFCFVYLFIAVFTFWLMPEKYASFARITIEDVSHPETKSIPQAKAVFFKTEMEILTSSLILNQTAKDLDLTQLYTKQLNLDRPLTLDESSTLLRRHIRLNQPRGTDLIEIWVNDLDRQLAAATANHIVQAYQNQRAARGIQVTILDIAKPGLRPVSPNIFYNLAVGFLISLSLALFFGILAAAITRRLTRSHVATQS